MTDLQDPTNGAARSTHCAGTRLPSDLIHDLRTPLNQIIGYSEMLMEQAQEAGHDDFVPDLQKVRAAGQQLLALISDNFHPIRTPTGIAAPRADQTTPRKAEPAAEAFSEHPAAGELASGTAQGFLLVVDDIEANRDLLSRRLERQGYTVVSTENGQLALEMLSANTFDLVLLDIMMPEMDGYELLQRLKADDRLQHIPVIMISAVSEIDSVVRCIEMGAEDYLPKPFDPVLLKARIGACLEKKRLRDREVQLFEQLQASYERLQELEKLRDELTHMIVHDLRTPLTSIITGLQTVALLGGMDRDQQELMERAGQGGRTLLGMINDLLDISKMECGAMQLDDQELAAAELVEHALQQVAPLVRDKGLQIARDLPAGLPRFSGDSEKLRRTLVNLLGNAIKFTPTQGTITLRVRFDPHGSEIAFAVQDTGEGIPHEAQQRIFDKFGQVETRQAGRTMSTGLGLTFCKMTVEAHGGRIWVESEAGHGSTFWFALPVPPLPGAVAT